MSFSLLLPKLTLSADERYELAPGFTLRCASQDEVDQVRTFIGDSQCFGSLLRAYLEGELVATGEMPKLVQQERSKWCYNVVEFTRPERELLMLQYALDLLPWAFVLAITMYDSGKRAWHHSQLAHHTLALLYDHKAKLPPVWRPILCRAFDVLNQFPPDAQQLQSFKLFHELKHLPGHSDAHALGLFSVLEMILTHKPKLNLHDSLTHQVSSKMTLLSKRFPKNELSLTFPEYKPRELWKALYDWRSAIAHGESYDFKAAPLRKLVSRGQAHGFLEINVRFLLKASLDEPELIADLKQC